MSQLVSRRSFLVASAAAAVGGMLKPAIGEPQDLAGVTLRQASHLLRSKAASPVDLTQACLRRIQLYNSRLDAFITILDEQALADARAMEIEQSHGKWRGPLHGIPIALKDNIDTAGTLRHLTSLG